MSNATSEYDPFYHMSFTYDRCFLCGCMLNKSNYSEEHVFPKWLQGRYDLWNQNLVLLNNASIRYKNIRIPCCKLCNGKMNDYIEKPIENGVREGYSSFIGLDEKLIFLWLNKISYGLLFKELSLRVKLSDISSEPIYKAEYLQEHKMQYLFLKSIINNTSLVNNPCSILVFRINPDNDELYWAVDNPFIKVFFIRMGDIGIIAHLMDNGFNKNFFMEQQSMRDLLTKTLYPIQFAELCAQFLYKSYLFYRDPFYTTVFDQDKNPQLILSHDLSGYGYKEWDQKEYAGILAFYLKKWGLSFVDLYRDDNKVMTYLRNEDGTFKDLSLYA